MHALPVCIICYLMLIQCNECVCIIDSFYTLHLTHVTSIPSVCVGMVMYCANLMVSI